jgi:Ca2+-binding RTX toxin-like protein
LTRNLVNGAPDMVALETVWPATFTIGSTAFLGETSSGTWTLKLADKVTGIEATFNSLTVRAWGSAITADSQYVLTNEFAASNPILSDTNGTDTLNAAAAASTVLLDLRDGNKSTVGAGELTIAVGSIIENAIAGLGNDTLIGNAANNLLRGNAGNDTVNGGDGTDTAVFNGSLTGYTLTKTGATYTVRANTGTDGTDTLNAVESLRFADKTVNLTIQAKAAATPQADVIRLTELYVAFFNRVPDADGLAYWIEQKSAGQSINQIADTFYSAGVQYSNLTGFSASMTNEDFVNVVYRNVLGRPDGADAGGMAYWSGLLAKPVADGGATRGSLVSTILDSAHTYKGNATFGFVADLLDNKYAVAKTFAIDWGLNYNTAAESISQGMAIAAAVTPTGTTAAISLIGVSAPDIMLA